MHLILQVLRGNTFWVLPPQWIAIERASQGGLFVFLYLRSEYQFGAKKLPDLFAPEDE
jgi:hypothetical protein